MKVAIECGEEIVSYRDLWEKTKGPGTPLRKDVEARIFGLNAARIYRVDPQAPAPASTQHGGLRA